MEYTCTITGIDHNDLVDLFSTAIYGNPMMSANYAEDQEPLVETIRKDYKDKGKTPSIEDIWAEIIIRGGQLRVLDIEECYTTEAPVELYSGNYVKAERLKANPPCLYYVAAYTISMETIMKGLNSTEAFTYAKTLFIDEEGDMYTAYNLMQIILWGEVIY